VNGLVFGLADTPEPKSGGMRGRVLCALASACSFGSAQSASEWPSRQLQSAVPDSYVGSVLLPTAAFNLNSVMERPFETIRFSEASLELGFLDLAAGYDTSQVRRGLYNQVIGLGVGDRQRTSIDMVYVGLEDGVFLGYFSPTSYTERAASGLAVDLSWAPYDLATVDAVCAASDACRGVSGKSVSTACPSGAPRGTSSACKDAQGAIVAAADETTCEATDGNVWCATRPSRGCPASAAVLTLFDSCRYVPCTDDGCCDESIRNDYRTNAGVGGAPSDFTRWRVYDHRARPWYKECRATGQQWSSMYEFSTSQALGLTAMVQARDASQNLLGVFAMDYDVGALSTVVNNSLSGQGAWGFAVERSNGLLVAISTGERLYNKTAVAEVGFSSSRLRAANAAHPSIAAAAALLADQNWPANVYHRAGNLSVGYEFQSDELTLNGLDWLVVVGMDIRCERNEIWTTAGRCSACPGGTRPAVSGLFCEVCPPGAESSRPARPPTLLGCFISQLTPLNWLLLSVSHHRNSRWGRHLHDLPGWCRAE
jgi:hypothetical protein